MSDLNDSDLLGYGYAPGNYMGTCRDCSLMQFDLDKRAIRCRECAIRLARQSMEVVRRDSTLMDMTEPVAWLRSSDLAALRKCNYMLICADSPKIWAPNDISTPSPDMGLVPVYDRPLRVPKERTVDPLGITESADESFIAGWNACREEMLESLESTKCP